MAVSIGRRNRAAQRAERDRCPKCGRKSALKTIAHYGQVVTYCRWDDCDHESVTDLMWNPEPRDTDTIKDS